MALASLSDLDLEQSEPESENLDFAIKDQNSATIITGKVGRTLDAPEAEEFCNELFSVLISAEGGARDGGS